MRDFITGDENIIDNPDNAPATAFVIVESKKGYMLLYNKHYKHWELTGGYMEKGESPKECAIRECKEESNQHISDLKFFGIAKYTSMNAAIYYAFLTDENTFIENDEIQDLRWWKPDEEFTEIDIESRKLITLHIQQPVMLP